MQKISIALVGDYNDSVTAHLAIPKALHIAAEKVAIDIEALWIATEDLDEKSALANISRPLIGTFIDASIECAI